MRGSFEVFFIEQCAYIIQTPKNVHEQTCVYMDFYHTNKKVNAV